MDALLFMCDLNIFLRNEILVVQNLGQPLPLPQKEGIIMVFPSDTMLVYKLLICSNKSVCEDMKGQNH